MRRLQVLHRLPVFAAAGVIAFLFFAALWNYAVERDHPKWRLRSAHPLAGVAKPTPTPVSLEAFLSGETQKSFSTNLGRSLPVFPMSVRAKNQLLYSLFDVSGASGVLVGRHQQLFERYYIDEFCKRGAAIDRAVIDQWATRIRESQDAAEAMGKGFVYLLSPSKASQYPQYFPVGLSCPALTKGATDKLAPFRAALEARRIRYVDGPALLDARKGDYPIDLFPRGGTHWNLLGAALATREATQALAAGGQGSPLGLYDFDWRVGMEAEGTDRDLLDLLNLLWPDAHYPVAKIARKGESGSASCERAPRIVALGGSFVREIIVALAQAACPPEIDYWFSMRMENESFDLVRYRTAPGEVGNGERRPASVAELRASLASADVVLLEENEATILSLSQVANLWQALHAPPLSQSMEK